MSHAVNLYFKGQLSMLFVQSTITAGPVIGTTALPEFQHVYEVVSAFAGDGRE